MAAVKIPPEKNWTRLVKQAAGVTNEALADAVGAGPELARKWTSGSSEPRGPYMRKIRAAFPAAAVSADLALSDPRGKVPRSPQPKPGGYEVQTDEGRMLARKLDELRGNDPLRMRVFGAAWAAIEKELAGKSAEHRGPSVPSAG